MDYMNRLLFEVCESYFAKIVNFYVVQRYNSSVNLLISLIRDFMTKNVVSSDRKQYYLKSEIFPELLPWCVMGPTFFCSTFKHDDLTNCRERQNRSVPSSRTNPLGLFTTREYPAIFSDPCVPPQRTTGNRHFFHPWQAKWNRTQFFPMHPGRDPWESYFYSLLEKSKLIPLSIVQRKK